MRRVARVAATIAVLLTGLAVPAPIAASAEGSWPPAIPAGYITTIAGGDVSGPASDVKLVGHMIVHDGSVWFADRRYILRWDLNTGQAETVAGFGTCITHPLDPIDDPWRDEGWQATQAGLCNVEHLGFDSAGDLYYADDPGVREIGADGTVHTLSGTRGIAAGPLVVRPDGTVIFGSAGVIYQRDPSGGITVVAGSTTGYDPPDGVPATSGRLGPVWGLASDGDELIVGDGYRVRRLLPDGTFLTIAGSGQQGECGNGVPATTAQIGDPSDLTVEPNHVVDVIDDWNVRRIDADGTIHALYEANVPRGCSEPPAPVVGDDNAVSVVTDPAGRLLMSTASNVWDLRSDSRTVVAGNNYHLSGDGGPAAAAEIGYVDDLAAGPNGELYVADGSEIRAISSDGTITKIASVYATAIAVSPEGTVYAATPGAVVERINGDGTQTPVAGQGVATTSQDALVDPTALAFTRDGHLLIADNADNGGIGARIAELNADGHLQTVAGGVPRSGGVSPDDVPATSTWLDGISDLTVLPDGRIAFGDNFCYPANCIGRVRAVDNGYLRDLAGNSEIVSGASAEAPGPVTSLDFVSAVRADYAGNLFVGMYGGNILQITPDDRMHWIAGIGATVPPDGDGGPALQATILRPERLAVDSGGHLYVRTWGDFGKIRMIQLPAPSYSPPPIHITSGPQDGSMTVDHVSFAFDLAPEFGPAACDLDGVEEPCTSPVSYQNLSQGRHTFTVRPQYSANAPASRTWTVDATAPSANVRIVGGAFALSSHVTLRLSGRDDLSGIASFDIGRRDSKLLDGTRGLRRPSALQAVTGRTVSLYVRRGASTCVTVRSRDEAGNVSAWTRYVCVARAGKLVNADGWSVRRVRWSTTGRAWAQKAERAWIYPGTAHMRGLAVVATTCANCGKIMLRLNGHLVRTVSLHSQTTHRNVVVPLVMLSRAQKETIEIVAPPRIAHIQLEGYALLCGTYGCSPPWQGSY